MPIHKKINAIMHQLHGVIRDRKHQRGYFYSGYDDVNAALRPLFCQHGVIRTVAASDLELLDKGTIKVRVVVSHIDVEDDTRIESSMVAIQPSQNTGKTVEAQQVGQAISYAVRNVELKLFALTGNPDSDDATAKKGDEQTGSEQKNDDDDIERQAIQDESGSFDEGAVQARFSELTKMFRSAKSEQEIREIEKIVKQEWGDLKRLPGAGEGLAGARNAALQRCMPEED